MEALLKVGNNPGTAAYKEGDIVVAKSDHDIENTWAEMLIRGTCCVTNCRPYSTSRNRPVSTFR